MAKLEKRQMIILGVMVIVILFGAYDFLTSKKKGLPMNTPQKLEELKSFVSGLTAGTAKDTTANLGVLIFSRAEKEWTQDPFLDNKSYKAWARVGAGAETAGKKLDFIYSGYVGAGNKHVAVVNGAEYKEGEALDTPGYVLRRISPTRVVIENRGTGTTLDIPLQE